MALCVAVLCGGFWGRFSVCSLRCFLVAGVVVRLFCRLAYVAQSLSYTNGYVLSFRGGGVFFLLIFLSLEFFFFVGL